MVTNDLKLKRTLDEADDKKACQLSLYYLKKLEKIFSNRENIVLLKKDITLKIFRDLHIILTRLDRIKNITSSNHLLNLIEVMIRKTHISPMFLPGGNEELFENHRTLINYITILVSDILSTLNGEMTINRITASLDYFIMDMEHEDDYDDNNIDYYNDSSYKEDDYEFSAEEGYDNWFGK